MLKFRGTKTDPVVRTSSRVARLAEGASCRRNTLTGATELCALKHKLELKGRWTSGNA